MCRHCETSEPTEESSVNKPGYIQTTYTPTPNMTQTELQLCNQVMTSSEQIRSRLIAENIPFFANDNISASIYPQQREQLMDEVKDKVEELLKTLLIDIQHDHNTAETARRIAKMFIFETLRGRYEPPPKITTFPNTKHLDELIVTKAEVKSLCSHHFQNIHGWAWVGIIYADRLMGLSKIHRIVDHFSRRPQIQEELVVQIADFIESACHPLGVGVVIKADHSCVKARGVEQDSFMVSSVLRGCLLNPTPRAEFFELVKMSGTM